MAEENKKQYTTDLKIKPVIPDVLEVELSVIEPKTDDEPLPEYTVNHKRRMNRIFRVYGGFTYAYYPEADTPWRRFADRVEYRVRRMLKRLGIKGV